MTKNPDIAAPWRTFSRDYAGFGEFTIAPKRKKPRPDKGIPRFLVQISPLSASTCLNVSTRKVSYARGAAIVDWLRSRGHTAFLY